MKNILRALRLLDFAKSIRSGLLIRSLLKSNKQRGESTLKNKLSSIVPDLTDQYTTFKINMNDAYIVEKIRCHHAFQISLALKAIAMIDSEAEEINVVDIGDSSGTHLSYITNLFKHNKKELNTISVNLDPVAVDKIQRKGFKAILSRAEDLTKHNINSDIILSYQMLEHLFDPISFLHSMAEKTEFKYFVITVPYVQKSRVNLHQVRKGFKDYFYAENTHIFELCPDDWNVIFKFSGWEIVHEDRYTQYPKKGIYSLMKYEWRRFDFDGFYGVILQKDNSIMKRYQSWH